MYDETKAKFLSKFYANAFFLFQTMCSKSTPEMEQLSPLIRGKLSDHDL